jgi:hypothetical protein
LHLIKDLSWGISWHEQSCCISLHTSQIENKSTYSTREVPKSQINIWLASSLVEIPGRDIMWSLRLISTFHSKKIVFVPNQFLFYFYMREIHMLNFPFFHILAEQEVYCCYIAWNASPGHWKVLMRANNLQASVYTFNKNYQNSQKY